MACGNTLAAQCAIDMIYFSIVEGPEVNVVRAHFYALSAVVARNLVLGYMNDLHGWSSLDNLYHIADKAE